jgi:hypothetical protein
MLHYRAFSAWVTIDGVMAPEYAVEISDDENTVTGWIASETGKVGLADFGHLYAHPLCQKFAVHWEITSYNHDTCGDVTMDGNPCGQTITYANSALWKTAQCMDGISHGTTFRPFVFSPLELTGRISLCIS